MFVVKTSKFGAWINTLLPTISFGQDQQIENILFRPHQYAIDPVHVEVTGQLIPPQ